MLSPARRAALIILVLSANLVAAPITSAAGPPVAPTGLAAIAGDGTVSLAWDPNGEPDIAGYRVYRDGGPGGTPATLVGTGDIAACGSSGDEATAALLATIQGTVFTTGDNVYDNGTAAEFNDCYGPSWGQPASRAGLGRLPATMTTTRRMRPRTSPISAPRRAIRRRATTATTWAPGTSSF